MSAAISSVIAKRGTQPELFSCIIALEVQPVGSAGAGP